METSDGARPSSGTMPIDHQIPVLLKLHDSYPGSSGNHRYLTIVDYVLRPSERACISNLENLVLYVVREQAHRLKILEPDSIMIVSLRQLASDTTMLLGPPADSMDGRSKQYEVVDEAYCRLMRGVCITARPIHLRNARGDGRHQRRGARASVKMQIETSLWAEVVGMRGGVGGYAMREHEGTVRRAAGNTRDEGKWEKDGE
ncbi:hypothetical protein DENSPDRAFT_692767 [Dentipellis sp. KUC8613]|nr:hypothetical protein DENSPDRAFT_692767 [Dentipellis sp. KUC8613]